jgi:hypothetical protein
MSQQQHTSNRVAWNDFLRKTFIECLVKQLTLGGFCDQGFKKQEWEAIVRDFNSRTNMTLDKQQLQNQHSDLKKNILPLRL